MNNCLHDDVKRILSGAVSDGFVSGASILVLQDGKEILFESAGKRDIEAGKEFDRSTICRLYSMSKPITATAAMLLVEKGIIDLGEPVSKYLPSFRNMKVEENNKFVPIKRDILIRDLLQMTSGCNYPGNSNLSELAAARLFEEVDARLYTDNQMSTLELVNKIGNLPTAFQPGTHWRYGTSADILGGLIEVVTGMKFSEFLKKELFQPLHMEDTGFFVPSEKQDRLAKVYQTLPNGQLIENKTNNLGIRYPQDSAPAFESGGAGLVSTLDDYAKFASMLLNGGTFECSRILKKGTVKFLTSAQLMDWQQQDLDLGWEHMTGYTYGNLMRVLKWPEKAYSIGTQMEYGWDGWLGPYFANSPKDHLTFLLFMQKIDAGTNELTRKLRNAVFSECQKTI